MFDIGLAMQLLIDRGFNLGEVEVMRKAILKPRTPNIIICLYKGKFIEHHGGTEGEWEEIVTAFSGHRQTSYDYRGKSFRMFH